MTDAELDKLASRVVDKLLQGSGPGRKFWREMVLRVIVEQAAIADARAATAFLDSCHDRGVNIRLREDGKVVMDGGKELGPDLKAVWIVYKRQITEALRLEAGKCTAYSSAKTPSPPGSSKNGTGTTSPPAARSTGTQNSTAGRT